MTHDVQRRRSSMGHRRIYAGPPVPVMDAEPLVDLVEPDVEPDVEPEVEPDVEPAPATTASWDRPNSLWLERVFNHERRAAS